MPVLDIDMTDIGTIAPGTHLGTVASVKYQVKVGDKWNNEGTKDVDFDTWIQYGPDKRRVQYNIKLEKGMLFETFYFTNNEAIGFLKALFKAAGCAVNKIDFEEPIGKQVNVKTDIKSDEYGEKTIVKGYSKV